MVQAYANALRAVVGKELHHVISSTDANIPMSIGIPAVCVGVFRFHGAHTREEYTEKSGLTNGLKISIRMITALTTV